MMGTDWMPGCSTPYTVAFKSPYYNNNDRLLDGHTQEDAVEPDSA